MSDFRDHIAVIDYGMGNLHSVAKALEHVAPSATVTVTSDSQVVENADRVVFPGVGAIRDCMHEIQRLNIGQVVAKAIQTKPVLAICVGMQALMQTSEENGGIDCLKILPGQVKYFGDSLKDTHGNKLKVPHMGWNQVKYLKDHLLFKNIPDCSFFYFVHSYCCLTSDNALTETAHGEGFVSALEKDNILAVQFHPEKSQDVGLELYKNFLNWSI